MQVELREPVRILPDSRRRFSDGEYLAFCRANPDLNVERTAEGEIVIVAPVSSESSYREGKVLRYLDEWADEDGRGKAFNSNAQFMLPDGSARSPDAAWVSNESLSRLSIREKRSFPHLVPEFIVEVRSPSDSLKKLKTKMERWIANGVQLGWLIGGDNQTVYIHRRGEPVEERRGIHKLAGEGPVKGFVLNLRPIWQGLR
jgi:Uma2 family endonuclease